MPLQHGLQIISYLEGGSGLATNLLDSDALCVLGQSQTLSGADIEDGQVGNDLGDAAGTGQGERAV